MASAALWVYCGIIKQGCETAYDCRDCLFLHEAIAENTQEGWQHLWLCHDCMRGLRDSKHEIELPGYFTEGTCEDKKCVRGDDRSSIVLQIVLWR